MPIQKLLVGISGSIGTVDIISYFQELKTKRPCEIQAIMTPTAARFLPAETVRYFIDGPVFTDLFDSTAQFKIPHVHLPAWADAFLILPASANIIGKLANGIADDLLSTAYLNAACPVILAPNMNERMLQHPAVQHNLATLASHGCHLLSAPEDEAAYQVSTGRKIVGGMPAPTTFCKQLDEILGGDNP